ncbi:hypothetical protein SCLCIDRAFT_7842 [Scleroderma citrinum Foug A]|uniref:Uncharacterized protein n=1 Tax=Scleroderma citrinum Foug A TaxID=1036808 RepID=A0A0C3EEK8_9AGAM|nr:hypothetical protein SCLCIDRAFT_7842 [Scleroderma citrinum Foug A]
MDHDALWTPSLTDSAPFCGLGRFNAFLLLLQFARQAHHSVHWHDVLWTPSLTDSAPFCGLGCFNAFPLLSQFTRQACHGVHHNVLWTSPELSTHDFSGLGPFLLHGLSGINCTTSFLLPLPLRPRKATASTVIVPQAFFRAFGHTSLVMADSGQQGPL